MRQEPEYFNDQELVLIYIAKKLKEALQVEECLTHEQIAYCVETDEYEGGLIFRTQRTGAFFYVPPTDEEKAIESLQGKGLKPLPAELRSHH